VCGLTHQPYFCLSIAVINSITSARPCDPISCILLPSARLRLLWAAQPPSVLTRPLARPLLLLLLNVPPVS